MFFYAAADCGLADVDILSQAVLEPQTSFVMPEARGQEASSERDSLDDDDVERNADLYFYTFLINH